jgi:hypothetical protein
MDNRKASEIDLRSRLRAALATIDSRLTTSEGDAEYAGLAAATLANALAPNPEDAERVGIGLFAVVFAQCFSTLLDANEEIALRVALVRTLDPAEFRGYANRAREIHNHLLEIDSGLLKAIRLNCELWLKEPSPVQFANLVDLFKVSRTAFAWKRPFLQTIGRKLEPTAPSLRPEWLWQPFLIGLVTFLACTVVLGSLAGPTKCSDGWHSPSIGIQGA